MRRTKQFGLLSAMLFASVAGPTAAYAQANNKTITVVIKADPNNLDPCNITSDNGIIIRQNIIETLTELDAETSEVKPRLAESWTKQPSGAWRVVLRQGVKFHDGSALNAAAVAKAIVRMQNEKLFCQDRSKMNGRVLSTTVVDEHTLDVRAEPDEVLMPILLSLIGISSPKTNETDVVRNPVGTGPYIFKSWDPNAGIALERNGAYWGASPEVESVKYLVRPDPTLRASMAEVGEADVAVEISPQDAVNKDTDFSYLNTETSRIRIVMKPPLDDIRIRRALNLAFDRQAIIGTILHPDVVPATQFFLPKIDGYNHDLKVWPYDPERAKKLVDEARDAGVDVNAPIRLIGRTGFYPNQNEVLQTLLAEWTALGLNIKLEMMERAQFNKIVNKPYPEPRNAMLIQELHDNNFGDAVFTMVNRYRSTGRLSDTENADVDRLIDGAIVASGKERSAQFAEANRIIAEDIVPAVPMYHMVGIMRVNPRLVYRPRILSNGELYIADIKFKK